jgi:hypothetical protein
VNIFGLSVVKNEVDIISQSLRAAAKWCERIYVLDNGSSDGTWEKVQELSTQLPQVIPVGQDSRTFHSGIREDILRQHADGARPGDWWCILDVDEFYIDDPRKFLASVPGKYQVVWKHDYSYFFTTEDLKEYRRDPARYGHDTPIEERFRFYSADWSEIRFFRHPEKPQPVRIPWESPRTYPHRIRLKHFQYRSPEQIQKRLDTRRESIESGIFAHESRRNWVPGASGEGFIPGPSTAEETPEHWEERVVPTTGLHYDRRDGSLARGKPWNPPRDESDFQRRVVLAKKFVHRVLSRIRRLAQQT